MNITPTYPAQRECPSLPSVLEVHPWTPDCKSLKPKVWCASFLRVWKALNSSPTWTKLVLSSQNYELPLRRPGQGPNFNLYKWTKKSKTNQIGMGWKRRKSRKQRQRRNFYYGSDSNETQLMLIEYLACARHCAELIESSQQTSNPGYWCGRSPVFLVMMPKVCARTQVERKLMDLRIWEWLSSWNSCFSGGGVKETWKI